MEAEDIKKMFQANAKLRHIHAVDPHRKELEDEFERLSWQYANEYLASQQIEEDKQSTSGAMDIQNAMNVIVNVCQEATALELKFHPNNMTDAQIAELATIRNIALNTIVDELSKKQ